MTDENNSTSSAKNVGSSTKNEESSTTNKESSTKHRESSTNNAESLTTNRQSSETKHWLYREENRKTLWFIQGVILVLVMIPEFFVHHHAHFETQNIGIDASWGFYAWYGFATCAAMVIAAKLLGFVLKRNEDYYDDK